MERTQFVADHQFQPPVRVNTSVSFWQAFWHSAMRIFLPPARPGGGDAEDRDSAIGQSTSASSAENPTHASQGR